MAQLAIKNLSKLAPFAGEPWDLPHKFHLYLIIPFNFVVSYFSRNSCLSSQSVTLMWTLIVIVIISKFFTILRNFQLQFRNYLLFFHQTSVNRGPDSRFVLEAISIPNHWYLSRVEARYWKPKVAVTLIPISSLIHIFPNTNMHTRILNGVRIFFSQNTLKLERIKVVFTLTTI